VTICGVERRSVGSGLSGEMTLLESWEALTAHSRDARLEYADAGVAVVFPHWTPLNNAIIFEAPTPAATAAAAAAFTSVYADAGIDSWALWVPSRATTYDAPDLLTDIDGLTRDTTTLVMVADIPAGLPSYPNVIRTSIEVAGRAGDEPVPISEVVEVPQSHGHEGWVLTEGPVAIAAAWTYRHGDDVGVYAVGTASEWRRRGHARRLLEHLLADARRRGARTASLQSTAMGEMLYRRLGFRPVGRYEEWIPAAPAASEEDRNVAG